MKGADTGILDLYKTALIISTHPQLICICSKITNIIENVNWHKIICLVNVQTTQKATNHSKIDKFTQVHFFEVDHIWI